MESLLPGQLTGLFLMIAGALVAIVTAFVALVRSGRTIPPLARGAPWEQPRRAGGKDRRVPARG